MPTRHYTTHPIHSHIRVPDVEVWRNIADFVGFYQVSSYGRIKALARIIFKDNGRHVCLKTRIKKLAKGLHGHLSIALYKHSIVKTYYIHRLVLEAFVGSCPDGCEASHLDGNPKNNHHENLCWETHAENMQRTYEHGTSSKGRTIPKLQGENNGSSKFTDEQVLEMHRMYLTGQHTLIEIAHKFGADMSYIADIVNGVVRKHLNLDIAPKSIKRNNVLRTRKRGEENGFAKLKDEWIPEIRMSRSNGMTIASIARRYGVSEGCIHDVVHRKTFKHIP